MGLSVEYCREQHASQLIRLHCQLEYILQQHGKAVPMEAADALHEAHDALTPQVDHIKHLGLGGVSANEEWNDASASRLFAISTQAVKVAGEVSALCAGYLRTNSAVRSLATLDKYREATQHSMQFVGP